MSLANGGHIQGENNPIQSEQASHFLVSRRAKKQRGDILGLLASMTATVAVAKKSIDRMPATVLPVLIVASRTVE